MYTNYLVRMDKQSLVRGANQTGFGGFKVPKAVSETLALLDDYSRVVNNIILHVHKQNQIASYITF